jgi:hypothetical protein
MTTEKHAADRSKLATIIWFAMLASGPLIFVLVFLMLKGKHFFDLTPSYELGFLIAGLVSAVVSLPAMAHFRRVVEAGHSASGNSHYWQRVHAAMFAGHAAADLPFLIGMAAFLTGGFLRTAVLLLLLSLALNSRFRPPAH